MPDQDVLRVLDTPANLATNLKNRMFGFDTTNNRFAAKNNSGVMKFVSDDTQQCLLATAQTLSGQKTFTPQTLHTGGTKVSNNVKHILGAGNNGEVYFDGTDTVINPDTVGSGNLLVKGPLRIEGANKLKLGNPDGIESDGAFIKYESGDLTIQNEGGTGSEDIILNAFCGALIFQVQGNDLLRNSIGQSWIMKGPLLMNENGIFTPASTASISPLVIPHGVAPTTSSLIDGVIWTTTSGMFVRIDGVTKTITLT